MSEIDILTQQIIELEPLIESRRYEIGFMFAGLFGTLIAGSILSATFNDPGRLLGFALLCATLPIGVLLFSELNSPDSPIIKQNELIDLRSNMTKAQIKSLSCEELRLDILEKLESDNIPEWIKEHDEFQRDLYYHKCEIPLREEVMKLGDK